MREIKFRAWDTETKEMSYDFLSKNWLKVCTESPYVELMQYTGLKDKNGKGIYEGDILHNHRGYSLSEYLLCRWQEAIDDGNWTQEKPGFRFERINGTGTTIWVSHRDMEVIGNIYENPELIDSTEIAQADKEV